MVRSCFAVALVGAFAASAIAAPAKLPPKPRPFAPEQVAMVVGAAMGQAKAYDVVASLTTTVGGRLGGTPQAERAVEWALAAMKSAGLSNVRRELVKVPRWVRGEVEVRLVAPVALPLIGIALGNSPATPEAGVEAEILIVQSVDELKRRGPEAKGKIVLLNGVMKRTRDFEGYGEAVSQRSRGAGEAYKHGALAVLVRSVGTGNHGLAHTGTMWAGPFVPATAIRAEDADLIARHAQAQAKTKDGKPVRVFLRQTSHLDGSVESANVVGELPGREKPDEIVLIGAHLDAWDNGTGAIDDGAGCAIALETVRIIKLLGLQPRRTVRVVLFMNEENGLSGGQAYAETHKLEIDKHVAAMEADSGAGRPYGISTTVEGGRKLLDDLVQPLVGLGVTERRITEDGGADLLPITERVPVVIIDQDVSEYFDWHHTSSDTIDKINPFDLNLATAAFAATTFALADRLDTLPRPPPPKENHKK